jgi:flagellar motor switch protein FliN
METNMSASVIESSEIDEKKFSEPTEVDSLNDGDETSVEESGLDAASTPNVAIPNFQSLRGSHENTNVSHDIDLILDIPVRLTVELGRTKVPIRNILEIAQGAVIELDATAGDPLDVLVNGCLIAKGEVVVVNEKYGIRLTEIISPSERIQKLNR